MGEKTQDQEDVYRQTIFNLVSVGKVIESGADIPVHNIRTDMNRRHRALILYRIDILHESY